ncbi:MAG: 2-methylcitrate synthase [Pseudomonadota bacterium]|jgi:2-methylcitrate synthase
MDKEKAVGETAICSVGEGHGLRYRGYSIQELSQSANFEEVAYLLLYGDLPDRAQLYRFQQLFANSVILPQSIKAMLEMLPKTVHPMNILRTVCSLLGTVEPEYAVGAEPELAIRTIGVSITALAYWHHFHLTGKRLIASFKQQLIAEYVLTVLHQTTVDESWVWALNIALILYAEHEFNASTYAARVTVSTESDFYSGIVSAIGTLKGPLHGGANEAAMTLISAFKTPEAAKKGILKRLSNHEKIMGFGHRVYKNGDPRSPIIKSVAHQLTQRLGKTRLFDVAEAIEETMETEKQLKTNLDFYSAIVFHCLGIKTDFFTPIFVFSRITGWSAHIMEQRQHNRLIRPLAKYVGPKNRAFVPMNER